MIHAEWKAEAAAHVYVTHVFDHFPRAHPQMYALQKIFLAFDESN